MSSFTSRVVLVLCITYTRRFYPVEGGAKRAAKQDFDTYRTVHTAIIKGV